MSKEARLGGVTAEPDAEAREDHRIGLPAIFAAFFWLGVTSFGGNTATWLYHQIVQRRHWVTDAQFLSDVGLGRIMPGSGGVNLTVQVGQRLRDGAGAVAAVVGLLSGPLAIVLALAAAYTRSGGSPAVHAVLDGIAAAAIGLTFATGFKLLPSGATRVGPLGSHWRPCSASACCAGRCCPWFSVSPRSASAWHWCSVAMPDDFRTLLALVLVFVPLSLLSIGGGASLLADMEYQSVTVHGWTTAREFADLFAISRAAPGPGTMLSTLIGWKAAGCAGAVTATVALYLPSSLLVYGAAGYGNGGAARSGTRQSSAVWHRSLRG